VRFQSLFLEYILLIILAIYITFLSYSWYENNKSYFVDILKKDEIERKIELLDKVIYNLISFKYAKDIVEIDVSARCIDRYTILITKERCESTPIDLQYSGMIIEVNNTYYVYSNNTEKYYLAFPIGYFILESCYEGFTSYIVNTTNCEIFCMNKCVINVVKNESELLIK